MVGFLPCKYRVLFNASRRNRMMAACLRRQANARGMVGAARFAVMSVLLGSAGFAGGGLCERLFMLWWLFLLLQYLAWVP